MPCKNIHESMRRPVAIVYIHVADYLTTRIFKQRQHLVGLQRARMRKRLRFQKTSFWFGNCSEAVVRPHLNGR
jgi:hypothetical protein